MFDDKVTNQPAPPANLPTEPEDIFAKVDSASTAPAAPNALTAGVLKKKEPELAAPPLPLAEETPMMPVAYTTKGPVLGKILMILGIIVLLVLLAFAGFWIYNRYFIKTSKVEPVNQAPAAAISPIPSAPAVTVNAPAPAVSTATAEAIAISQNKDILFGEQAVDTDSDGLPDAVEKALGLNPNKADSDNDGLTDGDEVNIYRTNPLNSDTDNDGYSDGVEVKNGYNPLGPGKLTTATTTPAANNVTTSKK